jgi:biopolymer transport protein TolQ
VTALSQRRAADASEASLHTLGMFALALQVQDGAAPVSSGSRVLVDIITKATVINQAVLAILIVISVVSWAIILSKSLSYRKCNGRPPSSSTRSARAASSPRCRRCAQRCRPVPLVGVFQAGYAELNAQFRLSGPQPANPSGPAPRPMLKSLPAVDRALLRAATVEINKLEKRVPFLATGRERGTIHRLVWNSCWNHDRLPANRHDGVDQPRGCRPEHFRGADCTAAGLFAAIPAVLAYNHFSTR